MPHEAISITIDPNDPESIRRALNTEWLLTNGLGGYAMGTVLGVNTRRYHGLLVAATTPPVGRIVAMHSMIEQLVIPREDGTEEVIDLSTQQFVGSDGEPMLHPGGWKLLRAFEIYAEGVSWEWRVGNGIVRKMVSIVQGKNSVNCGYMLSGFDIAVTLRCRPFAPLRDFHALTYQVDALSINSENNRCRIERDGHCLAIESHGSVAADDPATATWVHHPECWNRFAYEADRRRNQDWSEDVQSAGYMDAVSTKIINRHWTCGVRASVRKPSQEDRTVLDRVLHYYTPSDALQTTQAPLLWAAKDFLVSRVMKRNDNAVSVIAGYPWFGDWGRDTMIALPGLMLCTKRYDEARSCLMMFAKHIKNGLIPNLFDDYGGAAHYNTVDASLWFVHAVHEYWKATKTAAPGQRPGFMDKDSHRELIAACRTIIAAYRNGTDFNIRMDDDGLISAGDETTQLTWMDAKRDGVVFTPRHGKPVEINALWFNALCCLAEMTDELRERAELNAVSDRTADSFRSQFWWSDRRCLHDVLIPEAVRDEASRALRFVPDGKLRPNQMFAVSLPFSPLNDDQKRAVVKVVGDHLLTHYGLRTLDRDDPNYRGRYEGNMFERDRAYHNGTVWPWLIGPYCEALLRINNFNAATKKQVRRIVQPLIDEMTNTSGGRCLGQIAEVYDGDPPHRPNGCPAQAWSVAEVLRITHLIES